MHANKPTNTHPYKQSPTSRQTNTHSYIFLKKGFTRVRPSINTAKLLCLKPLSEAWVNQWTDESVDSWMNGWFRRQLMTRNDDKHAQNVRKKLFEDMRFGRGKEVRDVTSVVHSGFGLMLATRTHTHPPALSVSMRWVHSRHKPQAKRQKKQANKKKEEEKEERGKRKQG